MIGGKFLAGERGAFDDGDTRPDPTGSDSDSGSRADVRRPATAPLIEVAAVHEARMRRMDVGQEIAFCAWLRETSSGS